MKYYERLADEERRKLVLGAVAFSSAMEGLTESRDRCLEQLRTLENGTVRTPAGPAKP